MRKSSPGKTDRKSQEYGTAKENNLKNNFEKARYKQYHKRPGGKLPPALAALHPRGEDTGTWLMPTGSAPAARPPPSFLSFFLPSLLPSLPAAPPAASPAGAPGRRSGSALRRSPGPPGPRGRFPPGPRPLPWRLRSASVPLCARSAVIGCSPWRHFQGARYSVRGGGVARK